MIRLLLNSSKRENFAFYDPESKITLRLDRPTAKVEKITQSIARGIAAGTIIDIDEVSGIKINANEKATQDLLLKRIGIVRNPSKAIEEAKAAEEVLKQAKEVAEKVAVEEKSEEAEKESKPKAKSKAKSKTKTEDKE